MLRLASLISLLALTASGCVELPDESLGATEQAIIECDTWVCGSNSPVIATYRFHELNINGLANAEGFQVISLDQAGIHYHLYVEQGKIVGRYGSLEIRDGALQNALIRLRRGAQLFAIQITNIGSVWTFARLNGSPRQLQTYELNVGEIVGGALPTRWQNLCSNPPSRDNPDVLGMNTFHSLVFEGERIDRTSKTIGTTLDASWFDIGCTGHALAKLAINGQTEAAHLAFGFNTTILERQAFLKMLVADYCGMGNAWTVSGQPLQWMDWRGYTQYVSSPANLELEARWNANGATCVNTPRVAANPTALGTATFGNNIALQILLACGPKTPPACNGGVTFFDSQPLLSANPL